jgi:hypothetical protein
LCSSDDLVVNLLTILVEEDFAFVFRVKRITNDIDVAVVGQFTLLFTCNFLVSIDTTVPELTVHLTDRILLTKSSQRILDVPTTRSLKCMTPYLCPWQITICFRQESDNSVTVTALINLWFPEAFINFSSRWFVHLLNSSAKRSEGGTAGLLE